MLQLFPNLSQCVSRVCDLLGERDTWKVVSHNVTYVSGVFRPKEVEPSVTRVWCHHRASSFTAVTRPQLLFFATFFFLRISTVFPCAYFPPSWSPLLLGGGVGVCWLLCVYRFFFFFYEWDVLFTPCAISVPCADDEHIKCDHTTSSSVISLPLIGWGSPLVVKSLHLQGGCQCVCLVGGLVEDTQSSYVSGYACGFDCSGPFLRKLIKHPVALWGREKCSFSFSKYCHRAASAESNCCCSFPAFTCVWHKWSHMKHHDQRGSTVLLSLKTHTKE